MEGRAFLLSPASIDDDQGQWNIEMPASGLVTAEVSKSSKLTTCSSGNNQSLDRQQKTGSDRSETCFGFTIQNWMRLRYLFMVDT